MTTKLEFIPVITILRGVAALMVCLFHFVCTTTGYIDSKTTLMIFEFGKLGVQIFFIISGIVLPLAMINGDYHINNWAKFLGKRALRIEPPYIATIILACIYLSVRSFMPSSSNVDLTPDFRTILLHIGYLVPFFENTKWLNDAFWTLAIEFQYYLLLIILFPMMMRKNTLIRIFFYALILTPSFFIKGGSIFFHWSSLFLLGMTYILFKAGAIKLFEFIIIGIITVISIFISLGVPTTIVALITILIIHYFPKYQQKQLNNIGNISYSLYLVHGITGSAIINVMSHYLVESYQKPIVILVGTIFSMFCAYLMYRFVEKPSQKYASKISYQLKHAPSNKPSIQKIIIS